MWKEEKGSLQRLKMKKNGRGRQGPSLSKVIKSLKKNAKVWPIQLGVEVKKKL